MGHHVIDLDKKYYPADTFPNPWIDDHPPLLLSLRTAENPQPDAGKQRVQMKVKGLTKEEWGQNNVEMREFLRENSTKLRACEETCHTARFVDILMGGLRHVFKANYNKKKKCAQCNMNAQSDGESKTAPSSPFQIFRLRHSKHPGNPVLLKAVLDRNHSLAKEVMRNMARDGWRSYLSSIRPINASAFFLYLARVEGRKPRRNVYPCRSPLLDQNGQRHFKGQGKCNILANFFATKLQQRTNQPLDRDASAVKRNHKTQWRRLRQTKEFVPVVKVEVRKAVATMAKKKDAGDDGLVAELLQNLSSLIKPVVRLYNLILLNGRMPHQLLRVIMISLDKPHKDPEQCKSKRPISLISILAKILEAVALHRMIGALGNHLDPGQYAYRRERGAEMHLVEFHDFVREVRDAGQYTYTSSVDVAAAFDNVPHSCLVRTVQALGVDP